MGYKNIEIENYPTKPLAKFGRLVKRAVRMELFVGLWIVLKRDDKVRYSYGSVPKRKAPNRP